MEKLSVIEVLVEFACINVCILQIYLEALFTGFMIEEREEWRGWGEELFVGRESRCQWQV